MPKIAGFCKHAGLDFHKVLTIDDAMAVRSDAIGVRNGVFYVNPIFSRGFDIKLAQDSYVVIVDSELPESQLSLTEAR